MMTEKEPKRPTSWRDLVEKPDDLPSDQQKFLDSIDLRQEGEGEGDWTVIFQGSRRPARLTVMCKGERREGRIIAITAIITGVMIRVESDGSEKLMFAPIPGLKKGDLTVPKEDRAWQ